MRKIELVMLDKNKMFTDALALYFSKYNVDFYNSTHKFLANLDKYSKDTKICVAYKLELTNGIEVTKKLHETGFTRLYMLTGLAPHSTDIPEYLTVLIKGETAVLQKLMED